MARDAARARVPSVLLVTGAYYPEISASGIQCRMVARALSDRARFSVLTTAVDATLPTHDHVDGVSVHRVHVKRGRPQSDVAASLRMLSQILASARSIDLVHLHSVSKKNVLVTVAAKALRKPLVVTLHTAGLDEPATLRRRGWLLHWAVRTADRVMTVSPQLTATARQEGVLASRVVEAPNGVDTARFRPATAEERCALRRRLGLPEAGPIVLVVGFFSRDKRPGLAFDAFARAAASRPGLSLLYVGATGAGYYEIDTSLADGITSKARASGLDARVHFAGPTNAIDDYYRASDVFLLPSAREACSMALLEAMACGLPAIATRLPGATDVVIEHGSDGLLFHVDDAADLTAQLERVLSDGNLARQLGDRARETAVRRFDIAARAARWLEVYSDVL